MKPADRITKLIDYLGVARTEFSKSLGLSAGSVNAYLQNPNRKPTWNLIIAIANAFPTLSMEWLIRGRGSMWIAEDGDKEKMDEAMKVYEEKKRLGLEKRVSLLEQRNRYFAREIKALKGSTTSNQGK